MASSAYARHWEDSDFEAFAELEGEVLKHFRSLCVEVYYGKGHELFAEEEQPRFAYLLLTGVVKLSTISSDGRMIIFRLAHAGEILGLGAILGSGGHAFSAETVQPCMAKAIPAEKMLRFLQEHPSAAKAATNSLVHEHRGLHRALHRLGVLRTAPARLAALLLEWNHQAGRCKDIPVQLTHEDIAAMAGVSRETITRLLHRFQQEGMIRLQRGLLTILQPGMLTAIVDNNVGRLSFQLNGNGHKIFRVPDHSSVGHK